KGGGLGGGGGPAAPLSELVRADVDRRPPLLRSRRGSPDARQAGEDARHPGAEGARAVGTRRGQELVRDEAPPGRRRVVRVRRGGRGGPLACATSFES